MMDQSLLMLVLGWKILKWPSINICHSKGADQKSVGYRGP